MVKITKSKAKEWLRRYLPAEVLGTITALASAGITFSLSESYALSGFAGTMGENVGYYGYFITIEFIEHHKFFSSHKPFRRSILVINKTTRNLLVEFGPAEVFDSFIIRPFAMSVAPIFITPYLLGVFIGKLAADAVFYGFAILGYEARKKWFKS